MFERFTERARKVMALANQQAQRFNHEYIDPAHILLALIMEGTGVGANVLKNLGVDLRKVIAAVEKKLLPNSEMVAMGKLPQTLAAKKVIEHAISEAGSLDHNYIGTEHLLLGLLKETDGVVADVLGSVELTVNQVRDEILNLLGAGIPTAEEPDENDIGQDELTREGLNKLIQCPEASAFVGRLLLDIAGRRDKRLYDIYLTFESRVRVQYRTSPERLPNPEDAPPARLAPAIVAQLKQLFGMSPTIRTWAQEGRMEKVGEANLALRATAMPTETGEVFIIHVEK